MDRFEAALSEVIVGSFFDLHSSMYRFEELYADAKFVINPHLHSSMDRFEVL